MSIPKKHKAVFLDGVGKRLSIRGTSTPTPGPGQVLIRAKALAINPVDYKQQDTGRAIKTFPYILGQDAVGDVVSVGEGVNDLKEGTRVLVHSQSISSQNFAEGCFQEYVLASAKSTANIPDELSFEDATVLPLAISTASAGLFTRMGLSLAMPSHTPTKRGQAVMIWGGSSSVGSAGIQLAVAAGFDVFTTCSKRNFEFVRDLGATRAFDYAAPSIVDDVSNVLKSSVEIAGAFDAIGAPESQLALADILAKLGGGKIACVSPPVDGLPATVTCERISGGSIFIAPNDGIGRTIYQDFLPGAMKSGQIQAKPDAQVVGSGLEALGDAMATLKNGVSAKKIVVSL